MPLIGLWSEKGGSLLLATFLFFRVSYVVGCVCFWFVLCRRGFWRVSVFDWRDVLLAMGMHLGVKNFGRRERKRGWMEPSVTVRPSVRCVCWKTCLL